MEVIRRDLMSSDEAVAKVVGMGKTTVIGRMGLTVAGLLIGAVIAFYLVFQFGENERQRELQAWQVRMGIVTESRYADVSNWLQMQKADLRALADNASLQLYMTILHGVDDDEGASAELEYLGNLLTVTAERAGFTATNSGASQVNANVARQGVAGIALLDAKNELVVSSHGFPALVGKLQAFLAELKPGEAGISQVFLNAEGQPTMAFAEPAFVLQGDETADSHIGVVVGVKQVTEELPPLLVQPGAVEKSAEAVLLRQEGLNVEYISPLHDGTPALKKKLNMDTPDLAAAFVMRDASGFGVMKDYKGDEVLVLGRAFEEVPWVLMYKIDRQVALADSEARVSMLVIVLGMVIVVVLIGMLALWYFGTSKRAKEAADKFEKLADRFAGQRNFMHLVTDSQPNTIAIFDRDGNYRWFNQRVIEQSGLERVDLFDKNVSAVLGPIEGKKMIGWVDECLDNEAPHTKTHKMNLDGKTERVFKSDFIMIPSNEQYAAAVLVVSQDITDSVREREKRETVMRQLVSTLVSLVDRRDPFSLRIIRNVLQMYLVPLRMRWNWIVLRQIRRLLQAV
ncbi:PAS domain S-box protein [Rhodospirillaceae bacterium RKSG073]|nr:PAS domain S-box protein [Curvivirga aplysinae]